MEEEKTCTCCKQKLPINEFNKKGKGLQNICKECNRIRSKRYYRENHDKHLLAIAENKRKYNERNKTLVDQIKCDYGCAFCEENDPCCIDFHHFFPEEKEFLVSKMLGGRISSWETIKKEINKCVCVCANCHRKIHAGKLEVKESMKCIIV